jgi:Rad3-related DNA helicase
LNGRCTFVSSENIKVWFQTFRVRVAAEAIRIERIGIRVGDELTRPMCDGGTESTTTATTDLRDNHGAPAQDQNALLESPTGTGKTLCLLCASLAYRKYIVDLANSGASTRPPLRPFRRGSELARGPEECKGG